MAFYYDEQFKKYLIQFMTIFSGMKVKVGKREGEEERLISLPVYYGSMDRVVAHLMSDHTQNKPLRIPAMSAYITGISVAPDRRRGIGNVRRSTHVPLGGLIPDDVTTVSQLMPIPYWVTVELQIYSSNIDQHFQCLEQIFVLFDPTLQIQKNDNVFDWTRIGSVELTGIRHETNYPFGANPRIIQSGLDFKFIAELSIPAEVKNKFVDDISLRLSVVDQAFSSKDPQAVLDLINEQGITFIQEIGSKDLNFK